MNTHPALQPRLDRSNVTTIVNYLKAERDEARTKERNFRAATALGYDAYARGLAADAAAAKAATAAAYARGLDRAVEIVTDMWAAAVIATDALADELAAALDDMADELAALADEDDEGVEDDG